MSSSVSSQLFRAATTIKCAKRVSHCMNVWPNTKWKLNKCFRQRRMTPLLINYHCKQVALCVPINEFKVVYCNHVQDNEARNFQQTPTNIEWQFTGELLYKCNRKTRIFIKSLFKFCFCLQIEQRKLLLLSSHSVIEMSPQIELRLIVRVLSVLFGHRRYESYSTTKVFPFDLPESSSFRFSPIEPVHIVVSRTVPYTLS